MVLRSPLNLPEAIRAQKIIASEKSTKRKAGCPRQDFDILGSYFQS
jgi:hypothetical protein